MALDTVVAVDPVAALRSFNRFYTRVIGVLGEGLLSTPFSLTEARVIFELAQRDATEVADLRRLLDIDAGYLSRVLARFEANGLLTREPSKTDARRQVVRLSGQGRAVFSTLDSRSAAEVEGLLSPLTDEDRHRLFAAMRVIQEILAGAPGPPAYVLRPLRPGDLGWVVHRHGVLYAEEYGWDSTFEALVARVAADYVDGHDAKREDAWIAELDGEPVGCVFCVKRDEETAQLRLLLTERRARGRGIGSRLVEECVRFARRVGYRQIMLWTTDVLTDARRVYERAGFELRTSEPAHRFGHDVVEQSWWRPL